MRWVHFFGLFLGILLFSTANGPMVEAAESAAQSVTTVRGEVTGLAQFSLTYLGYANYSWVLPDDAQSLTVSITSSSGDVALLLKHGSAMTGTTVAELESQADFISDGPSWNEFITVDSTTMPALQQGTYYGCVISRNQGTTTGYVNFSAQTLDPGGAGKLYFPHVDTRAPWVTELGVNNQGFSTLTGTMTLYDDSGAVQGSASVSVPPNGTLKLDAGSALGQSTHGYAVLDYTGGLGNGYTAFSQPDRYKVAVPAMLESDIAQNDLFLTHVHSDQKWWTGFALVNTTNVAKTVNLVLSDGSTKAIQLPARGHMAAGIRDPQLFGETKPNARTARITPAEGLIGLELFETGDELDGFPVSEASARNHYFPHMAAGDMWTGIALYNANSVTANLTLTPYNSLGQSLGDINHTLGAGEKLVGMPDDLSIPSTAAWLKVSSGEPLMGFFLLGATSDLHLGGASTVLSSATSGVFPAIDAANENLELYLANASGDLALVYFKALAANGSVLAETTNSIPAYGCLATTPAALFTSLPVGTASISFGSFSQIAAYQHAGAKDGSYAHILPASRVSAARASISIPGVGSAVMTVDAENGEVEMDFFGSTEDYTGYEVRSEDENHEVEFGSDGASARSSSDNGVEIEYDSEDGAYAGARISDHGLGVYRRDSARAGVIAKQAEDYLRQAAVEWWEGEFGSLNETFESFYSQRLKHNDILLRVAEIIAADDLARQYIDNLTERAGDETYDALALAQQRLDNHGRFIVLALKDAIAEEYAIFATSGEEGYAGYLRCEPGSETPRTWVVDLASKLAWKVLDTQGPPINCSGCRKIVGLSDTGVVVEYWIGQTGDRIIATTGLGRGLQREVFPGSYGVSANYGGEMSPTATAVDSQGNIYFYAIVSFGMGVEKTGIWRISPYGMGLTEVVSSIYAGTPYMQQVFGLDVTADGSKMAFSTSGGVFVADLTGSLPVFPEHLYEGPVMGQSRTWINDEGSAIHFFGPSDYMRIGPYRMCWISTSGGPHADLSTLSKRLFDPDMLVVDQQNRPAVATKVYDDSQPGQYRLDILDDKGAFVGRLPSETYPGIIPTDASAPAYVPEVQGYLFTGYENEPVSTDLFLWKPYSSGGVVRITSTDEIDEMSPGTRK